MSALVDLLYAIASALMDFMNSAPPVLLWLVLIPVVGAPLTLLHELGHALAALRLLGDRVDVVIGTHGRVARVRLGRIALAVNAWAPLAGVAGTASFDDSAARARDVLWIALAGPAVSLAGTVLTAVALGATDRGGLAHHVLWTATALGASAGVLNLIPMSADGPMSDGLRSDGRLALDALRAMRMAPPRRERRRGGGPIAPGSRRARLQPVYVGFMIGAVVFAVGLQLTGRY
jgi:hypothetical protein